MGGNHGGDGCVPLSRSIVDEIVSMSYIIPKWILTTFKDWTDGVPPGSELILHTPCTTAWTKNPKLWVYGSLIVANDITIPKECFAKNSEFWKRNWPRAGHI